MSVSNLESAPSPAPAPHVTILMATYNGERWLPAQLESFAAQSHSEWSLIVGDDGSEDRTRTLLQNFSAIHRVVSLESAGKGAAANFLSLLRAAPSHMPADGWLAFADQDDVWQPDRLARGIAALQPLPQDRPALYCSRTWIVSEDLSIRRLSASRGHRPGFRNALIQNIAAGNTILVNAPGARLLCAAAREIDRFVVHDWWAYQMIAGVGGEIVYDEEPTLLYRQHGSNTIGANDGAPAQVRRVWAVLTGQLRQWNRVNIRALSASSCRLTPANRQRLELFRAVHEGGLWCRMRSLRRLGLHRQSWGGTLAVWFSAVLRRL